MTPTTHTPPASPAQVVIEAFGGCRRLARLIGKSPSTVSRWAKPRSAKGTGGHIPSHLHQPILELARARDLELSPEDLIYGRPR